jgi:hypothetical protein
MRHLVWLAVCVAILRLFSWRIRGQARAPAPRPAQPPCVPRSIIHSAVPRQRRKYRMIDGQQFLDALAGINARFAAAAPPPHAATIAPGRPRPVPPSQAARTRHPALPRAAARIVPARRARRPHPPPGQKSTVAGAPTHAQFVTLSK